MGITTSYLKSTSRLGRLGVIYFICGKWTPPLVQDEVVSPEEKEEDEAVIEKKVIVDEEPIVDDAADADGTSFIDNTETSDSSANI